jgi:hypothetical protein
MHPNKMLKFIFLLGRGKVRVLGFLLFPSSSNWVLKRFSKMFPIVAPSFIPYFKPPPLLGFLRAGF